jgi:hypothetical protein
MDVRGPSILIYEHNHPFTPWPSCAVHTVRWWSYWEEVAAVCARGFRSQTDAHAAGADSGTSGRGSTTASPALAASTLSTSVAELLGTCCEDICSAANHAADSFLELNPPAAAGQLGPEPRVAPGWPPGR